jgi:hypothetical protein
MTMGISTKTIHPIAKKIHPIPGYSLNMHLLKRRILCNTPAAPPPFLNHFPKFTYNLPLSNQFLLLQCPGTSLLGILRVLAFAPLATHYEAHLFEAFNVFCVVAVFASTGVLGRWHGSGISGKEGVGGGGGYGRGIGPMGSESEVESSMEGECGLPDGDAIVTRSLFKGTRSRNL